MSKQQEGKPVVFYLETTQLSVFAPHLLHGVTFPFPQGIVQNMEIVHTQGLFDFFSQIIESQKLELSSVLLVYGQSLYFEKRLPYATDVKREEERKKFCHDIPFERVAAKDYSLDGGVVIASINRDFYDLVKQACRRAGVTVVGVIPQFLLTPLIPKGGMSPQVVKTILRKLDALKEQTIVSTKWKPQTFQQHEEYLSSHYSGMIIAIFIVFMIVVFGITGFILRSQFQSTARPATATPLPLHLSTPNPVKDDMLQASPAATDAAVATGSAVRMLIQHSGSAASQSAALQQRMLDGGFDNVESVVVSGVAQRNTLLSYSASASASVRSQVIGIVRGVFPDVVTQQSNDLGVDFLLQIK